MALVIALLGVLDGCAVERKCGIEGCPGDKAITERVQAAFNKHSEIGEEVRIETLDHVVYLSRPAHGRRKARRQLHRGYSLIA
jgi:hypothetical protein